MENASKETQKKEEGGGQFNKQDCLIARLKSSFMSFRNQGVRLDYPTAFSLRRGRKGKAYMIAGKPKNERTTPGGNAWLRRPDAEKVTKKE